MSKIYERGNTWFAAFKNQNGKRVVLTTKVPILPTLKTGNKTDKQMKESSRAKAQIMADAMEEYEHKGEKASDEAISALMKQGLIKSASNKISIKEFLDSFLKKKAEVKISIEQDRKAVKLFLEFLGKDALIPFDAITRTMAQDFITSQLKRVRAGTVKRYRASLSYAFNQAVDEDLLTKNPFSRVKIENLKNDRIEKKAFTEDEYCRLLEILPQNWKDLVETCIYSGGQRLGDLVTLRWENINFSNKVLTIWTIPQ